MELKSQTTGTFDQGEKNRFIVIKTRKEVKKRRDGQVQRKSRQSRNKGKHYGPSTSGFIRKKEEKISEREKEPEKNLGN